jgi:hypothetical protein
MSCWRRLRDWQEAGVQARLHQGLLERLHAAGEIDWWRVSLVSASVPAKRMARPIRKWLWIRGLSSLHKRIRPSDEPLPKIEIRAFFFWAMATNRCNLSS